MKMMRLGKKMKKMNKSAVKAVCAVAVAVSAAFIAYCLEKRNRERALYKLQLRKYIKAIVNALDDVEVVDFDSFSDYLNEYYGIKVRNCYADVVEYSSDKYKLTVTSDDIYIDGNSRYAYNMEDLETFFSSNRRLWGTVCHGDTHCHYDKKNHPVF